MFLAIYSEHPKTSRLAQWHYGNRVRGTPLLISDGFDQLVMIMNKLYD